MWTPLFDKYGLERHSPCLRGRLKKFLPNKPTDDGNLILSESEREVVLKDTPALAPYVRRYVGSREFINSDEIRYCLWLKDASPAVYHKNREVMRRIAAVRDFRLASSAAPTRRYVV